MHLKPTAATTYSVYIYILSYTNLIKPKPTNYVQLACKLIHVQVMYTNIYEGIKNYTTKKQQQVKTVAGKTERNGKIS